LRSGVRKIRAMTRGESCPPAIWIARRRMLKAKTIRPRSEEERAETAAVAPAAPKSRSAHRVPVVHPPDDGRHGEREEDARAGSEEE
jgi:hypothetical protein